MRRRNELPLVSVDGVVIAGSGRLSERRVHRTVVVGLVWNRCERLLLCRMSPRRGVFPGQWGLPGGGVEPEESIEQALRRELREEIGIEVGEVRPALFKDGVHDKTLANGERVRLYMIFLLFHCRALDERLTLGDELIDCQWVRREELGHFDLNVETRDTIERLSEWGMR